MHILLSKINQVSTFTNLMIWNPKFNVRSHGPPDVVYLTIKFTTLKSISLTFVLILLSWLSFLFYLFPSTFKHHVSCTDAKISVRIIYFYYLFFHSRPNHKLCFLSCMPFVVNATFSTGLVVSSVSWLWQLTAGV